MTENTARYQRQWEPHPDNTNDSLTKMYDFVTPQSRVLDVGCSVGQLGKYLRSNKECHVIGLDINNEAASQAKAVLNDAIVADITTQTFLELFPEKRFDFIIFADVLEHLVDPIRALTEAQKVLADQGTILISVPNVTHASVRLALLEGKFDYRDEGLLDRTHLTFFTYEFLFSVLSSSGLAPIELDRTYLGARDTEIPISEHGIISAELIETIEREPEATTYQFIAQVAPIGHQKLRHGIFSRISNSDSRIRELRINCDNLQSQLQNRSSYEILLDQHKGDILRRLQSMELRIQESEHYVKGSLEDLDIRIGKILGRESERAESLYTTASQINHQLDGKVEQLGGKVEQLWQSLPFRCWRWIRGRS